MPEPLNARQRRVLGVLIEKALTTPEQYPLSANAMAAGASQKSNREPFMELDENAVLDTVAQLRKRDLVELANLSSGRVNRWKHRARETWNLERPQLALVAELLLRGPQTVGELRTRASRMYPFETLEVVQATLESLMNRPDPLARQCPAVPGERAVRFRHTVYEPHEATAAEAMHYTGHTAGFSTVAASATSPATADPTIAQRLDTLEQQVSELRRRLDALAGG